MEETKPKEMKAKTESATISDMKHLFNSPQAKEIRRRLRKKQTTAEILLWGHLRGKRFHGVKFFRQYGIGKYILDFYCPKKKFAIEVDGSQHLTKNREYDKKRTEFLESLGIHVFRVLNNDVMNNIDSVLHGIYHAMFREK